MGTGLCLPKLAPSVSAAKLKAHGGQSAAAPPQETTQLRKGRVAQFMRMPPSISFLRRCGALQGVSIHVSSGPLSAPLFFV